MRGKSTHSEVNGQLSYDRLWTLLAEHGMLKEDLKAAASLSSGTIAKLSKGGNLQTETLLRICLALNCDVSDIVEVRRPINVIDVEVTEN